MSVILLARHAQASFGAAEYDELSELGRQQAALLSSALADRGAAPGTVLRGEHRRHAQTADHALWPDATVDPRWNEFDHRPILAASPASLNEEPERHWLLAKERWASGQHDADYEVTFGGFTRTLTAALHEAADAAESGQPLLVISSAGAIAALVVALLGGNSDMWLRLQTVVVNTGLTKVTAGRRGRNLISFNDHGHLEPHSITYR